jgi:hypothetical protein
MGSIMGSQNIMGSDHGSNISVINDRSEVFQTSLRREIFESNSYIPDIFLRVMTGVF